MMNNDREQFEDRLQRQPLRPVPPEWRGQILGAAEAHRNVRAFTSAATIRARLREVFWPAPAAWAALGAVWVLIIAVNFSLRDLTPSTVEKCAPPSADMLAELRQQQLLLAELLGPHEIRDADRPKIFTPKPRGARMETAAV